MRILKEFHRSVPVASICVYRALLCGVVFLEALVWLFHTEEFYSTDGFHVANWSWLPVPSREVAFLMCLALVVSALMATLGLFTRYAIVSTLFFWTYFYGLDSINEKAAQTIAISALSILAFSACGNRLSLDNYLRKRRGLAELPGTASNFCLRLLQIEFMQIYFFAGVAKMSNPDWVNGNAFYHIMNSRWATELGIFISAQNPDLLARMGGLGTILFELFISVFLMLPATRPFAVLAGVFFHAGIQATLWIGTLGAHFVFGLVCLFPSPEAWAAFLPKLTARFHHSR